MVETNSAKELIKHKSAPVPQTLGRGSERNERCFVMMSQNGSDVPPAVPKHSSKHTNVQKNVVMSRKHGIALRHLALNMCLNNFQNNILPCFDILEKKPCKSLQKKMCFQLMFFVYGHGGGHARNALK